MLRQILESPKVKAEKVYESGSSCHHHYHVDKLVANKESDAETKEELLRRVLPDATRKLNPDYSSSSKGNHEIQHIFCYSM